MGSIAAVYVARRFFNPLALKVYALAVSLAGILVFVSLSHVGANLLAVESHGASASAAGTFVVSALTRTTLLVQLALAVGTLAFLSLILDAARSLRSASLRQGRAA